MDQFKDHTFDANIKDNQSLLGNFSFNKTMPVVAFQGVSTVLIPLVYFIVCVIGLSGNTLVIYVVLRYTKMKTVTNIYIFNLAMADELFMLGLPFLATQNALSYWPYGTFLCRLVMTVDGINQFTSIFCLTVMSIDRYLAVVHPIKSTKWRRPRVAKMISATVWLLSFLVVLPVIIYADIQEEFNTCNINWPDPKSVWSAAFIIYASVIGFFGPLLVISLCYLLIVIKIKSSSLRVTSVRRRNCERKVTRMVVVIVLVFVICWLPFYILNIVNLIVLLPEEPVVMGIYFFGVVLSYANSCTNPILYGFLSDNFKQSFRKVLCLRKGNEIEDCEQHLPRLDNSKVHNSYECQRNNGYSGHMQTSQL
ncbi:somatostatin receptor type 5 [Erpetoichthys calabaricus]|uniref:Somatostatin receptor type 5-like n=1 Tax=Erpetoichthys calabaricus TaxID=27687 RepID=A0A8C4XBZ4_ERPCA|nr:somatostatin receptor type 5 [Erpetoichthys calabaricus]XP_051789408.1 somatostatin receptor type 5 [Erpetoichthys calabaricus]XP_051789409.1 somatostatin receptor type 5 [Erpetoichthys calabaricus]XP_051789410.1 somatostatin receptor type 5 [Erpetoichthys calabaricus]XP_051789411.1 somatostatin receptor type 5 [Erpetoichthys calabaricus]XP_051789412.1 somatostatin receptor type 5 [Erpetoichthys calabaricus]XP_051789413.1 somatostatin receptor type 5 [Erpetoichthys calabaricus]XP_05178941